MEPNFYWGMVGFTTLIYLLALLPYLLLGLAIPYAVLRLRDSRSREADPQLGLKVALHFFFSLSILIVLTGLNVLAVDTIVLMDLFRVRGGGHSSLFPGEQYPNPLTRTGLALTASGVLFVMVHLVLIVALASERGRSPTRRLFLGWRLAIHGVVVILVTTFLAIVQCQKPENQTTEARQILIGTLLVWVPSWLLHLALLRMASPRPRPRPRGEPTTYGLPPLDWDEPAAP